MTLEFMDLIDSMDVGTILAFVAVASLFEADWDDLGSHDWF